MSHILFIVRIEFVEEVAKLVNSKIYDDLSVIVNVRDESDRDGMRVVLELRGESLAGAADGGRARRQRRAKATAGLGDDVLESVTGSSADEDSSVAGNGTTGSSADTLTSTIRASPQDMSNQAPAQQLYDPSKFNKLMHHLLLHTKLQVSVPGNMVAVVNGGKTPRLVTLREMMEQFIAFRWVQLRPLYGHVLLSPVLYVCLL